MKKFRPDQAIIFLNCCVISFVCQSGIGPQPFNTLDETPILSSKKQELFLASVDLSTHDKPSSSQQKNPSSSNKKSIGSSKASRKEKKYTKISYKKKEKPKNSSLKTTETSVAPETCLASPSKELEAYSRSSEPIEIPVYHSSEEPEIITEWSTDQAISSPTEPQAHSFSSEPIEYRFEPTNNAIETLSDPYNSLTPFDTEENPPQYVEYKPHSYSSEPLEYDWGSPSDEVETVTEHIEPIYPPLTPSDTLEYIPEPNPYSLTAEPEEFYLNSLDDPSIETITEFEDPSLNNLNQEAITEWEPSFEQDTPYVSPTFDRFSEPQTDSENIEVITQWETDPSYLPQNRINSSSTPYSSPASESSIKTLPQPDLREEFNSKGIAPEPSLPQTPVPSLTLPAEEIPHAPLHVEKAPNRAHIIPEPILQEEPKKATPTIPIESIRKNNEATQTSQPAFSNPVRCFNKDPNAPCKAVKESINASALTPSELTTNDLPLNEVTQEDPLSIKNVRAVESPHQQTPPSIPTGPLHPANNSLPPGPLLSPMPQLNEPASTNIQRPATAKTPISASTTPGMKPLNQAPLAPVPLEIRSESASAQDISINFNNVSMIEFIRFISKVSNKNFIFDDADLQFNVTIVSEDPTSIDNLMAALLQELKIRDLSLMSQGNNIIIHRNPKVRSPAPIVADGIPLPLNPDLVTRVFRLNTLDPARASEIIRPLISDDALIEILSNTNTVIITDITSNVNKIAQLISALDAPNSGVTIGQYVVRNAFVDSLINLAEKILMPIAQGNPFVLVPQPSTNSIFIVSNPFIVERALAILENLDINEGRTRIFNLESLRLSEEKEREETLRAAREHGIGNLSPEEQALLNAINGELISAPRLPQELPIGHMERTVFFIHKLRYRLGDQIEIALRKIADSLIMAGTANADLISAINSIQWIESSNSLILTGTPFALDRVRALIEEIDTPLRQVFIEMLVLNTTISDSLRYGVDWGTRFGGGGTAGAQAFIDSASSSLLGGLDSVTPNAINTNPTAFTLAPPNPTGFARTQGYHGGIIGRHLTHHGTQFSTVAALVDALHTDAKANILLNPKIITEDNHTAEIFVGQTARYKTQSISNDIGNVITNNFQFIDVGTTLHITPLIGNDNVITLDLIQEVSTIAPQANVITNLQADSINVVPVLNKTRTATRVHVPDGFFVVISGMIQDSRSRTTDRVPCLGGIPILGGVNKHILNQDDKNNLMLFMRPLIVDSALDLEELTKRNQDITREKNKYRRRWNYEIDEAMDFLNLIPADPDEIGCTVK